MRIFLAPRSNETSYKNFLSTIENGVDYSVVAPHLTEEGKKILSGAGKLFVWGNKGTKKSSWDKMQPNDLVLFYKGREGKDEREGKLVYAGRLLYKQESKSLGLALWPPKPKEEPWTCIFFLKDLQPVYIPISELADLGGYSRNFIVQGFMPLNEEGVNAILKKFGSIDVFIKKYSKQKIEGESDLEESTEVKAHSEAQMLLLKIGRMLDFDTYSPDKSKEAYGERLDAYITQKEIPGRFLGKDLAPLVRQIDVIWYREEIPKFAFEVEHSTKFGSGFQRLCQLVPLSTKLTLISATSNYHLYEKFINADPYYKYKDSFRFRSYKELEDYFRAVSEFSAIKNTFLEK